MNKKHTPVYFDEVLDGLRVTPGKKYIDATAGLGGHMKGIRSRGGEVLGIDWEQELVTSLQEGELVHANFAEIARIAREHHFDPASGVLFDLGISQTQLSVGGRGLSYRQVGELLDMKLNPKAQYSAGDLLASESIERLYEIFAKNAEEIHAQKLAREITISRKRHPLEKVGDLLELIDRVIGQRDTHVYARVFQALRIEVNQEFENLKKGLAGALEITERGGRIVVITFHSVEDRIVKRFAKEHTGLIKEIDKIKKSDVPNYARSAQVRILEKIA